MAQSKLVRAVKGSVLDVAVDLREGSPAYRRYVSRVFSARNRSPFFYHIGFDDGFCTLEAQPAVF